MKPDWKDAPKWAKYLAMDKGGKWWWWENKPTRSDLEGVWWANHGLSSYETPSPSWGESLEERPE